jgi:hypothetical protein
MRRPTGRRWTSLVLGLCTLGFGAAMSTSVSAQTLSRVSLDSVTAVDLFEGQGASGNPGASVDISGVVRLGDRWSVQVRPWFFKSSSNGSAWNKELYQAAVQYVRPGTTALRLDAGYIASPIGLGILDMRADVNPTIQTHMGYVIPMMPFDRNAPSVGAITASYPLGANLTLASIHWDARAALVSSSPARRYAVNQRTGNPKATPVVIAGGGITPIVGLRFGGSFSAGRYATESELQQPDGLDRQLRMWTVETEYAFGYTKLAGEYTRERFARGSVADVASTWFVQGMQTLTPRWFAAARHETVAAPPAVFAGAGSARLSYRTSEAALGYRLTPELTLRSSVTATRWYTAHEFDQRVGVQIVWSRRWW